MKKILFYIILLFASTNVWSQINITESGGWLESAFVKWTPVAGADSYNVYYSGGGQTDKKIDTQLIRSYGTYFRADVLGLAAGNYTLKIVPIIGGAANNSAASTTPLLIVKPHLREGFAFANGIVPGAYNMDGTPKTGAKILYVTGATANSVVSDVIGSNGVGVPTTGIMNILTARGKGYDKVPLIIRMIGTVRETQISSLNAGNFLYFGGSNSTDKKFEYVTFEGVGDDATAYGYGFGFKRSNGIELRNVGIMMFGDDGVGMDTDNSNNWIHNNDFFYGKPGSDADQVKGDGSIDMKGNTSDITISYNHFWDSGKAMGCGGTTGETSNLKISFHHNWFDHVDSRTPRLHYITAHVYNNYYDGVAKYSIGNTTETSAFVEGNYFRHSDRPMMISGQGTDTYNSATGTYTLSGTFSGQAGGMTKAFNNKFDNSGPIVYQSINATQFDAYLATTRNEIVPPSVVSFNGAWPYNNFDTDPTMYVSNPDSPDDARTNVMACAGRMNGGDFKWTFNNAVDDDLYVVNEPLKAAIVGYQSALVSVQGIAVAANQTLSLPTNNNQTVMTGTAIASIVFTWGGDATDATLTGLPAGLSYAKDIIAKTIIITGTPTASGSYSIITNGAGGTPATGSGTITVTVQSTQMLSTPTNQNQTVMSGTAINPIIYTWGGDASDATVTGLPISGITFAKDPIAKTITISGNPTAIVSYAIATSGIAGTPITASGTITITSAGDEIHNFSLGTTGCESTFYSFPTGNATSTSYGPVTYNGLTLTRCLKTGSTANVTYTTTQKSTLTLVFSEAAGTIKLDGILKTAVAATAPNTGSVLTIDVNAGTHAITKGSSENHLFYMKTSYATLGVKQDIDAAKLTLYPNPVTNTIFLSSFNQKIETVEIYNLTGTLVKSIANEVQSVDISNLVAGVYLVKVTTDYGTFVQRIIKK